MTFTSTSQWLLCPLVNDLGPPTLMHTLATSDECWTDWAISVWLYSTLRSHSYAYIQEAWYWEAWYW
jgi:hypothetical protein